jgi:hypothetical protein
MNLREVHGELGTVIQWKLWKGGIRGEEGGRSQILPCILEVKLNNWVMHPVGCIN